MDRRPIRRFRPDPAVSSTAGQRSAWPLTAPAVAQVVDEGLELPAGALVLVGENGSGQSTLMELMAVAPGLNPEGGSAGARPPHPWQAQGGALDGARTAHELSHGEAFLEVLTRRAGGGGTYLLDEPDAALSFGGSLALVTVLLDLVAPGAQVVVATHSPVVAALPGATLLEVGPWGLRPAAWADLELTANWRQSLDDPRSYLRHLG